jgi:allophanate hydrolase subunit 1
MRELRYGDRAVLVELDPADDPSPVDLRTALLTVASTENESGALDETVPAARTLLIRFDPERLDTGTLTALIARAAVAARSIDRVSPEPDRTVVIPVVGGDYRVAFCGFAPGFAYLTGLDPRLQVPRLESPRTSVAAGSVAIAGPYTAAYPRPSPGGWRLLGHTDAALWDVTRAEPALLIPGTRVRFEALG